MVLVKLTRKAPMTAPIKVPLPPTATQIAISIEFDTLISEGEIIPLKGTKSAPAIPVKSALRT